MHDDKKNYANKWLSNPAAPLLSPGIVPSSWDIASNGLLGKHANSMAILLLLAISLRLGLFEAFEIL